MALKKMNTVYVQFESELNIDLKDWQLNVPVFCMCSNDDLERTWTECLISYLRKIGMRNLDSNLDFIVGRRKFDELQKHLQLCDKIIIVLSTKSNKDIAFYEMMQQSLSFLMHRNELCRVIPVLISKDTELPLPLMHKIPFNAWKERNISTLVKALFYKHENDDVEELFKSFLYYSNQIRTIEQRFQCLSKCDLSDENCSSGLIKYGSEVLKGWGIRVLDKLLIIDMRKLQISGHNQINLLHDIFACALLPNNVESCRVTGLKDFSYKESEKTNTFDELVNLYITAINNVRRRKRKLWYVYRRHGLSQSNDAFIPIIKAITSIYSEEYHSPEFTDYKSRLDSFKNFPIQDTTFLSRLAHAGFFHCGSLGYTQCFCCGNCLSTWNLNHDPILRHKTFNPYCNFIQEIATESDVPGTAKVYTGSVATHESNPLQCEKESVGFTVLGGMKEDVTNSYNGNFISVEDRYASLAEMTKSRNRTDLDHTLLKLYSEAGFLYYGTKEDITCFSCNVGLEAIVKDKNPWFMHLNTCAHMRCNQDKFTNQNGDDDSTTEPYVEGELKEYAEKAK